MNAFSLQQRRGITALFVLACILLSVYLRLDFYPETYYGDEEIPLALISHMEKNDSLDTNWSRGIWRKPTARFAYGYEQYNFSSYNSTLYYLHQLFRVSDNNVNPIMFNRITSVAFQTVALVVIFYSINYLIGIYGAIAASLFFVFNPLLVVDARYARPESFLILITTLAILFHLLAITREKSHYFFISAFMWGIACACKFSLLPMAGLCGLHLLMQYFSSKIKMAQCLIWLICFLGGVFLLAPYMFIHINKVAEGVLALFHQYFGSETIGAITFQRSDLLLPKYLLGYFGAAFWLMIMLSLLHANAFLKRLAIVLLATCGFYILIFSLLSFFNESNLSHLAFVWCLLLAIAVEACLAKARGKTRYINSFFIVILTTVLATPALCSFKIKNEVYDQAAGENIQATIEAVEKNLLKQHAAGKIIDITGQISLDDQHIQQHAIIKVAWIERNELRGVTEILRDKNYVLLHEVKLPLSELPHSQLQTIHFPASYRYYQFKSIE